MVEGTEHSYTYTCDSCKYVFVNEYSRVGIQVDSVLCCICSVMTHVKPSLVSVVIFSHFCNMSLRMQKNMLNLVNIDSARDCILKSQRYVILTKFDEPVSDMIAVNVYNCFYLRYNFLITWQNVKMFLKV